MDYFLGFAFKHHSWQRLFFLLALSAAFSGCQPSSDNRDPQSSPSPDPIDLCLVPHEGDSPADREIKAAQGAVTAGGLPVASLERLGWAYVSKARENFDPGFYRLAEACADAIEQKDPGAAESLLIRGHVLNSLHRFHEAEAIARELVERRGIPFDHLLLGDALMEQGKLEEAILCYQTGVDLRPGLQSYARVGWIRWLIGDLPGAIEATGRAVDAGSPQDPGSLAWAMTRLGSLQFLANEMAPATASAEAALRTVPEFPPALLLKGRIALARGQALEALPSLRRAAILNPLPEYQWTLAEALRSAGQIKEAAEIEAALRVKGAGTDPRTFSLFLATRGDDPERSIELARAELEERKDVFTLDALAWALCSAGQVDEARSRMNEALAIFPEDGRLFLHAAVIEKRAGAMAEARDWLEAAREYRHTLLPSEQIHLDTLGEFFAAQDPPNIPVGGGKTHPNKTNTL